MPFWLTVAIGIGGSIVGGLIADIFFGRAGSFLLAYLGAIALVILYRRFIQQRPVSAPTRRSARRAAGVYALSVARRRA
jgi:hypothetical protein